MSFINHAFVCLMEFSFVNTRTCGILLHIFGHCLHPLQWRHIVTHGVWNHQQLNGLSKYLFRNISVQWKHQSPRYRTIVRWIHLWTVGSPRKWPVTRKAFLWRDVVMIYLNLNMRVPPFQCEARVAHKQRNVTVTSWWAPWRLKSPASRLFTQAFIQTQIKENIKAPRHWLLCGELTGDRWIPRTNGQ